MLLTVGNLQKILTIKTLAGIYLKLSANDKKKNLSKKDKNSWEDFIRNPSGVYDKDQKNHNNLRQKSRFKFDLHGFTLEEANLKVKELILNCSKNKFTEILLITGKGLHSKTYEDTYVSKDLSKLKFSVPEYIKSDRELNNVIISINVADKKSGGEGAILIKLKKPKE